jgi:predicted nucleic acid-binding OB-fold protein
MIKLEHITTDKIIFAGDISTAYAVDIKMFLIRKGIEDYQALKDFLESGKKVVGREFLEERLQLVEEKLKRDNDLGLEPQIYMTDGYQNVDLKSIKKSEVIAYDDLGTEAIRKLEVVDFPIIVVVDSKGNNLYEMVNEMYRTI